jgi:hypothetical protein
MRLRITVRRGLTPLVGTLEVRVRDDGGPWGSWQHIPVARGVTEQTAQLFVGGVFRRRQYHFRYTNEAEVALLSAEDVAANLETRDG